MHVSIESFGYMNGVPQADTIFDCRIGIPNPHRLYPGATGLDAKVYEKVVRNRRAEEIVDQAIALIRQAAEGDCTEYSLAFGCIGGRHRSVAVAVAVTTVLRMNGHDVVLHHRELSNKERKRSV